MSDHLIWQVPATIAHVRTLPKRALRLWVETQEIGTEDATKVMNLYEKMGWFTFSVQERKIQPEDLLKLPEIESGPETRKSPAQRLKASLFVWHKQRGGKEEDFPVFYEQQMTKFINAVKDQLN